MDSFFVTDLHGKISRYEALSARILTDKPRFVFIGGDILPMHYKQLAGNAFSNDDFLQAFLIPYFVKLKDILKESYPAIFIILGNDDARLNEPDMIEAEKSGIWKYIHNRKLTIESEGKQFFSVFGYSYVPPTPFRLKDWEKYDVSRFTDVGCVPPYEGIRTVDADPYEIEYSTIMSDIEALTAGCDLTKAIFLFHTPPYDTKLDRAALDNKFVDHVPLDVHVGSIAVKRFIEEKQPLLTLHGHIHESTRITGSWQEKIGSTLSFNAAHDGPELALIRFDTENPETAERLLL